MVHFWFVHHVERSEARSLNCCTGLVRATVPLRLELSWTPLPGCGPHDHMMSKLKGSGRSGESLCIQRDERHVLPDIKISLAEARCTAELHMS